MKKIRFYQVDAFTHQKFKGNPAGVVPEADGLSEDQMQEIAREMNNSETAFMLSPDASDHDVRVRFFTPLTEVPSCGHATIAAHYVYAMEKGLHNCTVVQKIGAGILPVEIQNHRYDYKMFMTQGKISFFEPFAGEIENKILKSLDLDPEQREPRCPMQIVSTGHSKIIIGIRNRSVLNALQPNMSELADISQSIQCNGYFVFTFDSDSKDILTHGRMFAPAIGINEDPVTGNANGPLGAYIVKHQLRPTLYDSFSFRGKQGEAMGRPGVVDVNVKIVNQAPVSVNVGGQAVILFQTEIEI